MTDVCFLDEAEARDSALVGRKAAALALMLAHGLPVPSGFCVATAAYRRLAQCPQIDASLSAEICAAYKKLSGVVAVRSSATSEDQATASFAGQMNSFLNVDNEKALLDAIKDCWSSFRRERANLYQQRLGTNDPSPAIGVVVQHLVPAVISGVLFTCDPLSMEQRRMIVEASAGVGGVVSGDTTPDRFVLDREMGRVVEAASENRRHVRRPDLSADRLAELAGLGRRVAALFGDERDIEWAWDGRQFWLLQARPITGVREAEREEIRSEAIASLAAKAAATGTVWSRYNLAETLPEATPMTWAILRRLLSGSGGLGMMYRDLGFRPVALADDEGYYDLICGRPYCNLSRETAMYANGLPLEHDFAALKARPALALEPRARPTLHGAGTRFWLSLPVLFFRSLRVASRLRRLHRTLPGDFQREILPAFLDEVRGAESSDWSASKSENLLEELERWIDRTLVDFARDALKPAVLAAHAVNEIESLLSKSLRQNQVRPCLNELMSGIRPAADADVAGALQALASGRMPCSDFLRRFGHRGPREMELAEPRWRECPAALEGVRSLRTDGKEHAEGAASLHARPPHPRPLSAEAGARGGFATTSGANASTDLSPLPPEGGTPPAIPADSHPASEAGTKKTLIETCTRIAAAAKLTPSQQARLYAAAERARTFVALRETAKHHLMKGYAIIRQLLVELDWRYHLHAGIFYLTRGELPRLIAGEDLSALISQRRRRHALELAIEVPPVIFSDDLEAIGRSSPPSASSTVFRGLPLSNGVAEGIAVVLNKAEEPMPITGLAILVCNSTDPAWTAHLLRARGFVTETGGVLSHGAIVARELGLPAVSGLPGVHRELRTGQRLRVDGTAGTVEVLRE